MRFNNNKKFQWLLKQYIEIRTKGKKEALRKLKIGLLILPSEIYFFLTFPIWLISMLFFRLISKYFLIRLGVLYSQRIGHFSLHTELYLSGLKCGLGNPNKPFIDIWCLENRICNQQLAKMWKREIIICPRFIIWPLIRINALLPGYYKHCIPHPDFQLSFRKSCLLNNVLENTNSHLKFTLEEEEWGFKCLAELGLKQDSKFICFHGRDSSYLNSVYPGDWSYHDYRDVDIRNYLPAVEELTKRGYFAIRMGSKVTDKFDSTNPMIIDYASGNYQSEFMDLFLSAKCEFFLSSGSGAFCPSLVFRRPQIIVNASPILTVLDYDSNLIFIPKKYWSFSKGREMTYREIYESNSHTFHHTQQFIGEGISLIENTPQEILDLVIEGEERYRGIWLSKKEDIELQNKFWAICPDNLQTDLIRSKIGASFLQKNTLLLN
jgi:putative glycosyltransferase (TIGR04372 family)